MTNEPGTETPIDDVDQRLYQEIVGSLLLLSTRNRPDISAAVGLLSRRCSSPDYHALRAAKSVLSYLIGTTHFYLRIARENGPLVAYSDSDWARDPRDRKSTSGILLQLGKSSVYWKSPKQHCVTLSTLESEFVALSETWKQGLCMRQLLADFELDLEGPTVIFEDNQGAIVWGNEGIRNAPHISIRLNYVKEHVDLHTVTLTHCPTEAMVADVLAKPLQRQKFEYG